MKTWKHVSWMALATVAQASLAQAPSASQPTATASTTAAAAFVRQAIQINMTELELSKRAMINATNPVVIKFSTNMVRELTQSNRDLRSLAQQEGLGVPASLDPEHAAMLKKLSFERGSDLHMQYGKDMAALDEQAIPLFQAEAADSSHPQLASYAQRHLPTIEESDRVAQQLAATAGAHSTG